MTDDKPHLVKSRKSLRVILRGRLFLIEIYRLENEIAWTLEIVNPDKTRHVWNDRFGSDGEARAAAIHALETEAPSAVRRTGNVVLFQRT